MFAAQEPLNRAACVPDVLIVTGILFVTGELSDISVIINLIHIVLLLTVAAAERSCHI